MRLVPSIAAMVMVGPVSWAVTVTLDDVMSTIGPKTMYRAKSVDRIGEVGCLHGVQALLDGAIQFRELSWRAGSKIALVGRTRRIRLLPPNSSMPWAAPMLLL